MSLIGQIRAFRAASISFRSTVFAALTAAIFTLGLVGSPVLFAGQPTDCPMIKLGNPNGNVCTAADVAIAAAIVGPASQGAICFPGDTFEVNIAGNLTVRNQSRFDIGVWIAQDGKALDLSVVDGGSESCEVVPLPNADRFSDNFMPGDDPSISNFDGEDVCGDTNGIANNDPVSNVLLTTGNDASAFNGPVTLTCLAGPGGGVLLQSLVSWNQQNPGVCDPTDSDTYSLDNTSKCSVNTTEIDVDIVGRVTVVKNAPTGGMTNFGFTYTNDSPPTNGMLNPGSPFNLQDGGSDEIYAVIGDDGTATVTVTEQNTMGWALDSIQCTGDTVTDVVIAGSTATITLSYDDQVPTDSQDDVTCTFNNVPLATLTLVKDLQNNNGGMSTLADWTLTATGNPDVVTGLANSMDIVNQQVRAGNYTLTEMGPPGYQASPWSCPGGTLNGNILTLANGDDITCTITNTDVPTTLTLNKTVLNPNGGDEMVGDFSLFADMTQFTSGIAQDVAPGTYTLSETGPDGYSAGSWGCTGGSLAQPDQLTIALGDIVSCSITNTDIAPTLTLVKNVTNSFGGNDLEGSFQLGLNGMTYSSGATPAVMSNTVYTVSETPNDGYTLTGIACVDDDTQAPVGDENTPFQLNEGQNVTCTYNNQDQAPSLTVVKAVLDGEADPADFDLRVTGAGGLCGQNGSVPYTSGNSVTPVESNCAYTLSEMPLDGYQSVPPIVCVDTGNGNAPVSHPVTLDEGQAVTCTISNEEIAQGTVTFVKDVDNGDGGEDVPGDFTLRVSGAGVDDANCDQLNGAAFSSGQSIDPAVDGCTYTLTEDPQDGYTQVGDVVCVDANNANADVGHPVTFATGQAVICTIFNDDDGALLALDKIVANNNGGQAVKTEWNLSANGPTPQSGDGGFASVKVAAGDYTLLESPGPDGYTAGDWECGDSATLNGNILTIANGEDVTCTITNTDQPASLTLTKTVLNSNGGDATPDLWTLMGNMTVFTTGVPQDIDAGQYTLTESNGPDGYAPTGPWVCTGDGTFTPPNIIDLGPGESAACTLENDDVPATLTLLKNPINDSGGQAVPSSFELTLNGVVYASGAMPTIMSGVEYTVSENPLDGYMLDNIACVDTSDGDAPVGVDGVFTATPGQTIVCTVTNDDIAPTLTLTKVVINDDNGELAADAFPITLTGADGDTHGNGADYFDGAMPMILADIDYTVTETVPDGYSLESIECVDTDTQAQLGSAFNAALGQNIACTVTNDDQPDVVYVRVTKDFTDGDNDTQVNIILDCNGGLIVDQDKTIVEGEENFVNFTVTDYQPGQLTCTASETPVPPGYSPDYVAGAEDDAVAGSITGTAEGCVFAEIEGGQFTCEITNDADPVDIVINKEWQFDGTSSITDLDARYDLVLYCDSEITDSDASCFGRRDYDRPAGDAQQTSWCKVFEGEGEQSFTAEVLPKFPFTSCYVVERPFSDFVEVDNGCEDVFVSAARGGTECTVTNMVFFEGIPTLSKYSMAILVLLMLGVGLVGFRRFS